METKDLTLEEFRATKRMKLWKLCCKMDLQQYFLARFARPVLQMGMRDEEKEVLAEELLAEVQNGMAKNP